MIGIRGPLTKSYNYDFPEVRGGHVRAWGQYIPDLGACAGLRECQEAGRDYGSYLLGRKM